MASGAPPWGVQSALTAIVLILAVARASLAYLVLVPDTKGHDDVIFNASVYKLGSERLYKINVHRTANFVHHLLSVDAKSGQIALKKKLRCDGILYPNLFTFYVDSTSNRVRDVGYYSLPIRILITGPNCQSNNDIFLGHIDDDIEGSFRRRRRDLDRDWRLDEDTYAVHQEPWLPLESVFLHGSWEYGFKNEESLYSAPHTHRQRRSQIIPFDMSINTKLSEAKQWISETYASFAIPTTDKWHQICLKKSQYINSLSAFLPKSIQRNCKVEFVDLNDERFAIEASQGDLVASDDLCIQEQLWKVIVFFRYKCDKPELVDAEHRLKIVYHHQELNDTDIAKRVRRELRNQSPFFEQALYVASVAEEQPAGVLVTTVRARDPENSPVTYSMTSLLDSRSQGMFAVDPQLGTVTTQTQLDRELLDVHYFRIVAIDDSFPPRSGTTTLQINVLDCNDHAPVFELKEYDASIRESAPPGSTLITVKATDQDIGKNAEIEYTIESVTIDNGQIDNESFDSMTPEVLSSDSDPEVLSLFRIDSRTGVLTTRGPLDRETVAKYSIILKATDQAIPASDRKSTKTRVRVMVLDDNDNYPQFSERTYSVTVDEDINISDNPVIANIRATDADIGANAAIRFAIIGGNNHMQFSIDSLSGDVSLVKPLDYEQVKNYRLVIRAQDGGSPSRSNTTQLLVTVRDVNDNSPRFYTSLFQEAVSESVPIGYSIVRVQAYDADEGINAEITYSISERDIDTSNDRFPLGVDPRTGWIYTIKELDREEVAKYQFQVIARDGGAPPRSASAAVVITVTDVNDNDPVFESATYSATLGEDEPPGTPVATVTATDPDEDNRLHYEITGGNTRGRFSITSQNGRGLVTIAQPLDYKQEKRYILTISAADSGGRTAATMLNINITDANNFAPVFENAPYAASVFEDAPIGTTVLVVSATDNDVGLNAQITYSLGNELSINDALGAAEQEFTINPQTGAILTNKLLDRESMSGYLLTVTARDGGNPPLSDTTDVEISVADVNDNKPVFKQPLYTASIPEDAQIGTSLIQVAATDADVGLNGRVGYSLSLPDQEDGSFVIDSGSGVIRTNKPLDRESVASYDLRAVATDKGTPALSSEVIVHVRIEDVNDSPPEFESDRIVFYIAENSPIGTTVGEIIAHDPDEGVNAIVYYSIIGGDDSNSFSLITRPGSDRAELVTMVDLDYESPRKKYELVVRAASPPLRSDAHVEILVTDVNDNAPVLKDFNIIFNNFKDCFPLGVFGKVPAFDADVTDKLMYRVLSGNNANLILLNQTTGGMTLSPQLNTNVPKIATMEVSVSDGVNEVKAVMQLSVRLITEEILFNSITIRLNEMTVEAFLSPLLTFFVDGLSAIIPCPKENIYIFSIQDDTDMDVNILNVSFSAHRPDSDGFYSPAFLRERVYLNRATLARLATVQVLPFDDNICVREPCLNYEECLTVLKFGNASGFVNSDTVLFRPIYPVTAFACQCPKGFTGSREHYLCDTEVNLCYSSPCKNNGACLRREGGYSCVCSSGFTGDNCETILKKAVCDPTGQWNVCKGESLCVSQREGGILCQGCTIDANYTTDLCELKARSFSRTSFLTFPSLKQRHRINLKLRFATQNSNGLLLYNGRYNEQHDFIALEVIGTSSEDGSSGVRFSFNLGGEVTEVSVMSNVADGEWHTVEVNYFNRTATLTLDNCDAAVSLGADLGAGWNCANRTTHNLHERCLHPTETCYRFLDLTGPLQIGGLPSIPSSFQVNSKDYVGCIADLFIDHKFIDLNSYVADNGTVAGCPEKKAFCNSNPCYNGGTCKDIWDTFLCDCPDGFTGKDCSESSSNPWRFSGDGLLSFNPLLRPIQLPWLNALSIRTRQNDAFLMSVQVGQNSSVIMSLKSGQLCYSHNSETLSVPGPVLSDGEWHRIELKWLGADIAVSLDYGSRTSLIPLSADRIQGLYVGKILVGGPDHASAMQTADFSYFEGCIQDVRVGTSQSLLNRPTVRENVWDGCHSKADCSSSECPENGKCTPHWDAADCSCTDGYVGMDCRPVCSANPCPKAATCQSTQDSPYYTCSCYNATFTEGQCVETANEVCPRGWWGGGVRGCGPCDCNLDEGFHPDCDLDTGECHCRENYYRPTELGGKCIPCGCYAAGSLGGACEVSTGQCTCRSGVIGRACDTCPNLYAEVTSQGCQVVYDGCPRTSARGVWWPRTAFGGTALAECPTGSNGRASRICDKTKEVPWQEPDMFNCTSTQFLQLRKQLSQLENGELQVNTFVGVKLAEDLAQATKAVKDLYGADILISVGVLNSLLEYEFKQTGLNLTHSQDKDYIKNVVFSSNAILNERYSKEWDRIEELTGQGVEKLLLFFDKYIHVLAESQHDTYTNPFEIVSENIVFGVDIVTAESIYGFEPEQLHRKQSSRISQTMDTTERVILPDTSSFLHSPLESISYFNSGRGSKTVNRQSSPLISFPKYNNYVQNKEKFDKISRILVPLDLLGIKPFEFKETEYQWSGYESRAVLSYIQHSKKGAASLMPLRFDESVAQRWGVDIGLGSPIMQLSIHVPEFVWLKESHEDREDNMIGSNMDDSISYSNKGTSNRNAMDNHLKSMPEVPPQNIQNKPADIWTESGDHTDGVDIHGPIIIQPSFKKHSDTFSRDDIGENDSQFVADKSGSAELPVAMALVSNQEKPQPSDNMQKKLVYKSLSGIHLKKPVRLQMWLDVDVESFGSRSNPQCVHWSTLRGYGEWSRVGCHTEIDYDWRPYSNNPLIVNCTCNHLSTFAVLIDIIDLEIIPEPSLLEDVTSYSAFCISLPILLIILILLNLMRGGTATISNTIHKHYIFSVFMAELLYLIALKARVSLVQNEAACRACAMLLHYWWCCGGAWACCAALHGRRMARELRDVNAAGRRGGALAALAALGYGAPALAVALGAGARAAHYGGPLFCWVGARDAAAWALVLPQAALAAAAAAALASALRAAFAVRDHVVGYGNLRMLLGTHILMLPLFIAAWASALLLASEGADLGGATTMPRPTTLVLSAAVFAHALTAVCGLIILNVRVRDNLRRTFLRCMGRKVPLLETSMIASSSGQNISQGNRSALAYHNSGTDAPTSAGIRRNIGISTASTTSRSTTKTSSSPYSRSDGQLRHTSTSTSNYNSTSDMPSYLRGFDSSLHRSREERERPRRSTKHGSEARDGAAGSDSESSCSHDIELASSHSSDDDESSNKRMPPGRPDRQRSCLPNITEGAPLSPITSPRWLPPQPSPYGHHTRNDRTWPKDPSSDREVHNEAATVKTPSPNPLPLPNPDLTCDTLYHQNMKPSILENVHDTYVANIDNVGRIPHDNRYGLDHDFTMKYSTLSPGGTKTHHPYDPHYQQNLEHYRLHNNQYGSKSYISSRGSDYGYSPTKMSTNGEIQAFGSRDFRDSGVATLLRNDYQRNLENQYGTDYGDRMSDNSDKNHQHEKYLFPYTAEEDHVSLREHHGSTVHSQTDLRHNDLPHTNMVAPLASMAETSEKTTTDSDAETRV